MKVYTKTGDKGETSLLGGTRVPKYHLRLESYGTLDELNSHIGLLRDKVTDESIRDFLLDIQHKIFSICSTLAYEKDDNAFNIPKIENLHIEKLENKMDEYLDELPELNNFILPGGNEQTSISHIARTVCRRAERRIIELANTTEIDELTIKYVNRLSDYFFVLARKLLFIAGESEIRWKPYL